MTVVRINGWQAYDFRRGPNSHSVCHFYINDLPLCGLRETPIARTYRPDVPYCDECDEQVMLIADRNMQYARDRLAIKEKEKIHAW